MIQEPVSGPSAVGGRSGITKPSCPVFLSGDNEPIGSGFGLPILLDLEGHSDATYAKQTGAINVVGEFHPAAGDEPRNGPAGSRFHGHSLVGHAERTRSRRLPNSE